MKNCILITSARTGKESIMNNCDTLEDSISIIKNKTFKNNPIWEGVDINFTASTEFNSYRIIEGNHKNIA